MPPAAFGRFLPHDTCNYAPSLDTLSAKIHRRSLTAPHGQGGGRLWGFAAYALHFIVMSEKDDEKKALDVLRSFAGLIALNLSLEQRLTDVVAKLFQESWERTFTRSPSWFDFYFTPPLESLERVRQLKGVKGSAVTLEPGMDLLEYFSKDGQRLLDPNASGNGHP